MKRGGNIQGIQIGGPKMGDLKKTSQIFLLNNGTMTKLSMSMLQTI